MQLNIHPIFVHFPIALLTVYALVELVRTKTALRSTSIKVLKGFLVTTGTIGAFVAMQTGELAEKTIGGAPSQLIETHSLFANMTFYVFLVLALIYLLELMDILPIGQKIRQTKMRAGFEKILGYAQKIIHTPFMPTFALIGLILVTITGALGGAIVYGADIDPVVHFIYSLFF